MRTTLSIDDALLRQAKSTAALEGKTLSALVEEKLRQGLKNDDYRPALVSSRTGGPRKGVNLTSNASIAKIFDKEDKELVEKWNASNRHERAG